MITHKRSFELMVLILFFLIMSESQGQKSIVKIIRENSSWSLQVDGAYFYIKGAVGNNYLNKIREYGGNSVRTSSNRNQLDKAYKSGLKALVNLPARAERDGMDYSDSSSVNIQTDRIISIVKKTKDHPSVLIWAIGNELDYIPPLKSFNPKVWDAVNQAAKAIHKTDPDHPVMTVIGTSMMWKVADIVKQCPDIDLLGINTYGDIYTLTDSLKKYGWTKPYVITEWGPDGYWEVPETPWGAPYEQTGTEKYDCYKRKYTEAIEKDKGQCLGSFVFYWSGFKQETTHTWFCMFDKNGLESPLVGLMYYLWTGQKEKNESPLVDSVTLEKYAEYQTISFDAGSKQYAKAYAHDRDGDHLRYRWEIRPEAVYASYAGQGEKIPEPIPDLISGEDAEVIFKAPAIPGPYRLFVYAFDDKGHFSTANLPFFVSPSLTDTSEPGRYTSRTLHLLSQSTPVNRNKVKILVYGQSISEQKWWLEVKRFVETRYPDAIVDMVNKSIGGFASQLLYKTAEMDVSSFYPDLVILHDYGSDIYYDSVLYTIRSRTAAEVAIMTDHYTGPSSWSDTMSYHILPALADKYKCDIINIRDPWKKYLTDHKLDPSRLLKDGVHLNEYGNFFMAELVKQLFIFRPEFPEDQFELCRTYLNGSDFFFRGDTLTLRFSGNKAEIIVKNYESASADSIKVMIDEKVPSQFQGCYYVSRPYNDTQKKWPWELPAMIHVGHSAPWINEEWTCTFSRAEAPYTDFSFAIEGSVTGRDGEGISTKDFISPSGRIIILGGDAEKGGDWHLNRSYEVLKTKVNPGDKVKWRTYFIGMDYIPMRISGNEVFNDPQVLFQGVPNSGHTLKLVKKGKKIPAIEEIRIYRPFTGR